jgi:L-asparaginase
MDSHMEKTPNKVMKIALLTTGGTIEKSYDEVSGTFVNQISFMEGVIKQRLRLPDSQLLFQVLMNKDSLDMNDDDRAFISSAVQDISQRVDAVVVLHGTDTMDQTVNYVKSQYTGRVPVIFTGSMKPFGFEESDAMQNITESLFACKVLGPGVFFVFHHQVFEAGHFIKNRERRTFERGELIIK